MECEFIRKNLFGILENTLPDSDRTRIEHHLNSCHDCSTLISEFRQTMDLIEKDISREINPFVGTRILERIETASSLKYEGRKGKFYHVLQPVLVTFSLLIAVLIGFSIGKKSLNYIPERISAEQKIESIRSELFISDITDEDKTLFIHP